MVQTTGFLIQSNKPYCEERAAATLMAAPICVIAPYPELAEVAHEVAGDMAMDVTVLVGRLHDGLDCARTAVEHGAEALISRGGTATLLKRHLPCPVVDIEVGAHDVLRCLTALPRGFQGKVALMTTFQNLSAEAAQVGQALNIDITTVSYTERNTLRQMVADAVAGGVQAVIGGADPVRFARELGIAGLILSSGRDAVRAALREAQRILHVLRHERQRVAELTAILNSSHDAVVAVDQENCIKLFNRRAAELFAVPADGKVVGLPIAEALRGRAPAGLFAGDDEVQGRLHQIGEATVLLNRVPMAIGGSVSTFQDVTALQRAEQKVRRELHAKGLVARQQLQEIAAVSPAMKRAIDQAARYAASDSTVLIQGESGSGKELIAQGIHNASPRRSGPFVAVNCAAIPESLLESELFGHVEGAFTGASRGGRAGLFELAHHGTIFLDEIGEMPLPLQSRLLRVLQEREVMRIGSDRVLPVNIRVLAATNRSLEQEVAAGRFRADLYYRLNILLLKIPPLRERPEDVQALLSRFLEELAARRGRPAPPLGAALTEAVSRYHWPGNVRELRGFAERIDLLAAGGALDEADAAELLGGLGAGGDPAAAVAAGKSPGVDLAGTLDEITHRVISAVLAQEDGNLTRTARRLGVGRTTLWRALKR